MAFIDQRDVLQTEVELVVDGVARGAVRAAGCSVCLSEVTAAYIRPHLSTGLPVVERAGRHSPAWRHAGAIDDALSAWADLSPARVVNRPAAMASNSCKPFQARFIREAGFDVPATLVTTDPDAAASALHLLARRGHSQVERGAEALSPARLGRGKCPKARARDRLAPMKLQQATSPTTDRRVHVIGERVRARQIRSEADDHPSTLCERTKRDDAAVGLRRTWPSDVSASRERSIFT